MTDQCNEAKAALDVVGHRNNHSSDPMTDPTAEARKVIAAEVRIISPITSAEHAELFSDHVIAALDHAGKVIVDKAPAGECAELVLALCAAVTTSGGIDLQSPELLVHAAGTISRLVRERDEARRALDIIVLLGHSPACDRDKEMVKAARAALSPGAAP